MNPPPLPPAARMAPERTILLVSAAAGATALFWMFRNALHFPDWQCGWKVFTGLPCVGCGGTRAMSFLLHGDWRSAFLMNPGAVFVAVFWAVISLYALGVVFLKIRPWRLSWAVHIPWRWLVVAGVAANWIYLLAAGRA